MIKRVLLDIDDVLNEFTVHALRKVGCQMSGGWRDYMPEWEFNIVKAANEMLGDQRNADRCAGRPRLHASCNMTSDEFWDCIEYSDWVGVPKSRWFDDVIASARKFAGVHNISLVTAPVVRSNGEVDFACVQGKLNWVEWNLPSFLDKLVICRNKWVLATDGSVLIDDSDANVNLFRKYGGKAITFPRPWNKMHALSSNPMAYVNGALEALA